jgi:hypothetical protein
LDVTDIEISWRRGGTTPNAEKGWDYVANTISGPKRQALGVERSDAQYLGFVHARLNL